MPVAFSDAVNERNMNYNTYYYYVNSSTAIKQPEIYFLSQSILFKVIAYSEMQNLMMF